MNRIIIIIVSVIVILAAGLVGLGFLIAGCNDDKAESAVLNVYNWEDYITPDTLEGFEQEFNVKINLETYQDEEEMLAAVQSNPGKYDVIFPGDELVSRMIMLKLLAPLDHEKLPNLENIDDQFLNLPYDPGNMYAVPYTYGFTGIAFNTEYITDPVDSWNILWDERYQGRIAMLNNSYTVIGVTLKSLGYSLNSTDPDELEQARLKLLEQQDLIVGYLDPMAYTDQLISEEIWLAMCYNGDAISAAEENPNISIAMPKEGSDFWVDYIAIPRDAAHKQTAHLFLNYIMRPDVQAEFCNYYGYACVNRTAIDSGLISEEDLNNPYIYPSGDNLETYQYIGNASSVYASIWAEIRR